MDRQLEDLVEPGQKISHNTETSSIRRNLDGGFHCNPPPHLQHIYLKLLVTLIVNHLVVNKKNV
jgi:hypothetical protein